MSLAKVAKAAGVSQATVSRVINGSATVSPDATRAVRAAMEQLSYEPPPLERRRGPTPGQRTIKSAARKSGDAGGLIQVLLLDEFYRYSPSLCLAAIRGIEREATDQGWKTAVVHAGEDLRPAAIVGSRVDGLVLMGMRVHASRVEWARRYPHVWMTSYQDPTGAVALAGNDAISRMAFDYLQRRGHDHMAYIAVTSSYPAYPARAEVMRFLGVTRGATVDVFLDEDSADDPLPTLDELQTRVNTLAAQFAASRPRASGLFLGNDTVASMIYAPLRAHGIEPGRDVDIISCNNDEVALVALQPRPATIDLGSELLGRRSVDQLLRKIRRPDETREVRIAISPILIEPPGELRDKKWP